MDQPGALYERAESPKYGRATESTPLRRLGLGQAGALTTFGRRPFDELNTDS